MGERIMVNGRELNFCGLPPEPKEEYTVNVDGSGEVSVTKGKQPERLMGNCDKCHYATRKRKDDSGVCARYPKWADIYDMTEHFCGEFAWAGSVSPLKESA